MTNMAWIDVHYAVICAEKRGVPVAMIRNLEINNRAGSTVNLIEDLRLIRRTLVRSTDRLPLDLIPGPHPLVFIA